MDKNDYNELTAQIDAREILRYLNHLGIHNISGEVLKYFITDLKKLIKYDLQHKDESISTKTLYPLGPERLHSVSTFSSRTRSRDTVSDMCCTKQCPKPKTICTVRSAPSLGNPSKIIQPKRACSCTRDTKSDPVSKETKTISSLNSNIIRVRMQNLKRKNDPVSLYQYYASLWTKYKPNVPGENNWSDLRWSIRQKMAGCVASQPSKTSVTNKQVVASKKSK